jgi:hemerythrin-like domain-containing protein
VKREKFLWPLTHGHQHGLAAAKALQEKLAGQGSSTREGMEDLRSQVLEFWESELRAHFQVEEGILRMLSKELPSEDKDVARFLSDHRTLEQLVKKGFREDLSRFADLLTKHIRFEEEVLFGRIELALSPQGRAKAGEMAKRAEVPGACPRLMTPPKG